MKIVEHPRIAVIKAILMEEGDKVLPLEALSYARDHGAEYGTVVPESSPIRTCLRPPEADSRYIFVWFLDEEGNPKSRLDTPRSAYLIERAGHIILTSQGMKFPEIGAASCA